MRGEIAFAPQLPPGLGAGFSTGIEGRSPPPPIASVEATQQGAGGDCPCCRNPEGIEGGIPLAASRQACVRLAWNRTGGVLR